nr:hypothetical protein [Paracoccus mutanolyticus]
MPRWPGRAQHRPVAPARRGQGAAAGHVRAGRGLAGGRHPGPEPGAAGRTRAGLGLQDRHILRASRRAGGGLRRGACRRGLAGAAGRDAGAGGLRRRSGRAGAVDLFDALSPVAQPPPPAHVLTLPNSALPLPLRRFAPAGEASAAQSGPPAPDALRLTFPPDGSELEAEGPILARARGGRAPWTFLLNGAPLAIGLARPEARLPHPGPGFARLTVIDGAGASDTAAIRLHMPEIPAN